jgi:hypothetical protein
VSNPQPDAAPISPLSSLGADVDKNPAERLSPEVFEQAVRQALYGVNRTEALRKLVQEARRAREAELSCQIPED